MQYVSVILVMLMVVGMAPTVQANEEGGGRMKLDVTSPAFAQGAAIPKKYTGDGKNISPTLCWSHIPSGTITSAVISDDPDAPGGDWVHWVMYNIPSYVTELPEQIPSVERLDNGALQGRNDFGLIGYGGPCPSRGMHHYYFKVFALDDELDLSAGASKRELLQAMEGHVIAEGTLMGTYSRR